jgi:hypothetical protein
MKNFTNIRVALVTNGNQTRISITDLALTQKKLVAPFYGNQNFLITIKEEY